MNKDLLDIHLRLLLLEHGRERVVRSLARAGEVSEARIEEQLASATKTKSAKPVKTRPTLDELLDRMQLMPDTRDNVTRLAREFLNKRFLGEMRLVERFLREHGMQATPKTRMDALPKVLSVLGSLPEKELHELVDDCATARSGSEFAHLAGAIMGSSKHDHSVTH